MAFVALLSGFKVDQMIELEKYLNARTGANFLKSANNVKSTLPPGTKGKIQEIKKFSSGNFGLKIQVENGLEKGQSVWVYYNTQNPGIKVYADSEQKTEVRTPAEAASAKLTRKHDVYKEPEATPKASVKEALGKISEANSKVQGITSPCQGCEASRVYTTGTETEKKVSQDKPIFEPLLKGTNNLNNPSYRCRSSDAMDVCVAEGDTAISKFVFKNTSKETLGYLTDGRFREWTFSREGQARQDLGLFISDSPNGSNSQSQESFLMFFPRKTLPTSKRVGSNIVMTLANGETVTFNNKNQVVNGVLAEQGPVGRGGKNLQPAPISYQGEGIMVRTDSVGNDPRLGATAQIQKGKQKCVVSKKELWPDQRDSSALHFKYASDADFESFLRQRCGFGF